MTELTMGARAASRDAGRASPYLAVAVGGVMLLVATVGLWRGAEPFTTWYYQFAWYSLLLAFDGVGAQAGITGRRGEFLLLGRPAHLLSLLGWSAVVWLFYELWNFRLQNWYYVNLPRETTLRWAGTVIAFATVLPAVFLSSALLGRAGLARDTRWRSFSLGARGLRRIQVAGALMAVLVLVWPRYFFPLVWGATTLLVEPWVYRRAPGRSLLHDLTEGRPGRVLRLLAGGVLIGFIWEMLNIRARAKWIYTVPGFEELKLFEMPLPGFLGFPPFALECFVLWQALVVLGVAVPRFGSRWRGSRGARAAALALALAGSAAVLRGMDHATVASLRPRLHDLDLPVAPLAAAGYDAFRLAAAERDAVAHLAGVSARTAEQWIERARLATLRGIGAEDARKLERVGIATVEQLAAADAAELARALERLSGRRVVDARVRVWVRAAQRAAG
ncbi:MAG TPA: helix-hairpin-helix domain-containing protein [Longimicrobiales bacterium]|nr:helix-hairpin-helix domain-containing protein [Longimicrobiales bacterium]